MDATAEPRLLLRVDEAGLDGAFKRQAARWTPRELRHSSVSLLSSSGLPIEDISHWSGSAIPA
jgi:hypothetical protein